MPSVGKGREKDQCRKSTNSLDNRSHKEKRKRSLFYLFNPSQHINPISHSECIDLFSESFSQRLINCCPFVKDNRWAVTLSRNQDNTGISLESMWWIISPVSVILSITGIAGHKRSWHSSMHSWCRPELLRDFFTTQILEIGDLTSWFNTLAKTCCVKTLCCWRQAEHASITCSTIPPPKYSQSSFQFPHYAISLPQIGK